MPNRDRTKNGESTILAVINKKGIKYCQIIRRLAVFIGYSGGGGAHSHCPIQHLPFLWPSQQQQQLLHQMERRVVCCEERVEKKFMYFSNHSPRLSWQGRSSPRAARVGYEYYYNKCPIQSILIHGQHDLGWRRRRPSKNTRSISREIQREEACNRRVLT